MTLVSGHFLMPIMLCCPFTLDECAAWKAILRGAALRFWLSRLYDYYLPREAEMLTPHDPRHFERILRLRVNKPAPELIA